MIMNIIKAMNWVDIFIAILIFRIIYCAIKKGLSIEVFKLMGTFLALYLAMHYYARLGNYFQRLMPGPPTIPLEFWDLLSLILLSLLGYAVFLVLREVISRMVKTQVISTLNKWGAAALGICRGVLLTGLIMYIFCNPTLQYTRISVNDSYLGQWFLTVAPGVYRFTWDNITSKFASGEEFNKSVLEVRQNDTK